MTDLLADYDRIRKEVLEPIRREAGMPEYDDEPSTPEELNRYIELLESAAVGNCMAARWIASWTR